MIPARVGTTQDQEDALGTGLECTIEITVLSAHSLPKPGGEEDGGIVSPLVRVTICGLPEDKRAAETWRIVDNGFNPRWHQLFSFEVMEPSLAMIVLEVINVTFSMKGRRVNREFLAAGALPFTGIREGIRWVPLFDWKHHTIDMSGLLVEVRLRGPWAELRRQQRLARAPVHPSIARDVTTSPGGLHHDTSGDMPTVRPRKGPGLKLMKSCTNLSDLTWQAQLSTPGRGNAIHKGGSKETLKHSEAADNLKKKASTSSLAAMPSMEAYGRCMLRSPRTAQGTPRDGSPRSLTTQGTPRGGPPPSYDETSRWTTPVEDPVALYPSVVPRSARLAARADVILRTPPPSGNEGSPQPPQSKPQSSILGIAMLSELRLMAAEEVAIAEHRLVAAEAAIAQAEAQLTNADGEPKKPASPAQSESAV
jgi:hypothetical protein